MRWLQFRWVSILSVLPFVVQIYRTSIQLQLQLQTTVLNLEPYPTRFNSTVNLPTEESNHSPIGLDLDPERNSSDQEPIPHNFVFHSWGPEGIELQPIL